MGDGNRTTTTGRARLTRRAFLTAALSAAVAGASAALLGACATGSGSATATSAPAAAPTTARAAAPTAVAATSAPATTGTPAPAATGAPTHPPAPTTAPSTGGATSAPTTPGETAEPVGTLPPTGEGCIDFEAVAPMAVQNPLVVGKVSFTRFDFAASPTPMPQPATSRVWVASKGLHGLDCGYRLDIKLPPSGASTCSLTLMTGAQPATVEAFDGSGASLGPATMKQPQFTKETFKFAGHIARLVVTAPADETVLMNFCYEADR